MDARHGISLPLVRVTTGMCVWALLLCLGGCQSQGKREPAGAVEAVNTGLRKIGDGQANNQALLLPTNEQMMGEGSELGSVRNQIEESARQLEDYFSSLEHGIVGADGEAGRVLGSEPDLQPQAVELASQEQASGLVEGAVDGETGDQASDQASDQAGAQGGDDGGVRVSLLGSGSTKDSAEAGELADGVDQQSVEVESVVGVDTHSRKQELVGELVALLSGLMETSDDPGSAALALAGLEMLLPADIEALVDEGVFSDAERASLDATRSFLRSMSSSGSIASPAEVAEGLERIQSQLWSWTGLTIKKAALCTQVDGYGRYETFSDYRFIAGRSQAAIVYVELERFAQREFVGPDGQARFESKLSQRLELYHVADDLNTWNRAAETVTDVTRNRLRDYYLINQITLPSNLSAGRYHLKVVMRDLISQKVAETIIPIEIVLR